MIQTTLVTMKGTCQQQSVPPPSLTSAFIFSIVCRAASYGRMGTAATAPNAVARGVVTTSGLLGKNAARFNDDIFGTGAVFIPPSKLFAGDLSASAHRSFGRQHHFRQ